MGKMGFDIMNALWKRTGSAKETLRSCPFLFEETFDALEAKRSVLSIEKATEWSDGRR